MDDDGTKHNRDHRDDEDAERGSSQTHGASDPSGVDAEPAIPPLRFSDADDGTGHAAPSRTTRRS